MTLNKRWLWLLPLAFCMGGATAWAVDGNWGMMILELCCAFIMLHGTPVIPEKGVDGLVASLVVPAAERIVQWKRDREREKERA